MPVALTPAALAKLRALYEDFSVPVHEIAQVARRSESVIYKYARRLGWKSRMAARAPRLGEDEIRSLYEDTAVPVLEIGRIARLSDHAIYCRAARGRWKRRAPGRAHGGAAMEGPKEGLMDVRAEVAAARRRAEAMQEERALRSLAAAEEEAAKLARQEEHERKRAAEAEEPEADMEAIGLRIHALLDEFEEKLAAEQAAGGRAGER